MGIYLKNMDAYPVLVSKTGRMFQATFVDIPGCRAFGATASEAEAGAAHALRAHIDLLVGYGRSLPRPSHPRQPARTSDCYVAYVDCPFSEPVSQAA